MSNMNRIARACPFIYSEAAAKFINSADARETSFEIMEAIAFFARSEAEALALWEGDGFGVVCNPTDLWERVTGNGRRDAEDFCWGAAGSGWWDNLQAWHAMPASKAETV